jgi:hypothetical protein
MIDPLSSERQPGTHSDRGKKTKMEFPDVLAYIETLATGTIGIAIMLSLLDAFKGQDANLKAPETLMRMLSIFGQLPDVPGVLHGVSDMLVKAIPHLGQEVLNFIVESDTCVNVFVGIATLSLVLACKVIYGIDLDAKRVHDHIFNLPEKNVWNKYCCNAMLDFTKGEILVSGDDGKYTGQHKRALDLLMKATKLLEYINGVLKVNGKSDVLGPTDLIDLIKTGFRWITDAFGGDYLKAAKFCEIFHWNMMQDVRGIYLDNENGLLFHLKKTAPVEVYTWLRKQVLQRIDSRATLGAFGDEVYGPDIWKTCALGILEPVSKVLTEVLGPIGVNIEISSRTLMMTNTREISTFLAHGTLFTVEIFKQLVEMVRNVAVGGFNKSPLELVVLQILCAPRHADKSHLLQDIASNGGKKFRELLANVTLSVAAQPNNTTIAAICNRCASEAAFAYSSRDWSADWLQVASGEAVGEKRKVPP